MGGVPVRRAAVYFFVHVMKTGGTSFVGHLRANFTEPELELGDVFDYASLARLRALTPERRAQVRAYAGHYPLYVTELVEPDVTMTILREPVARSVSLLRQVQRSDPPGAARSLEEIYDTGPARWTQLQNFQSRQFALTHDDVVTASEAIDAYFPGLGRDALDRPTTVYLDVDDDRLERAKARLAEVDVLGFQERYDDFLGELADRFGWVFPRQHRLQVADNVAEVPSSLLRRIEADNAADVELYAWATAR